MGRLINQSAAARKILRDVKDTLSNATVRGSPYQEDAERLLGAVAILADELSQQTEAHDPVVRDLRALQVLENERCNELIGKVKDDLFNAIGRTANDPVVSQAIFAGGAVGYTEEVPTRKPEVMAILITAIEDNPDPRIPPELVQEVTELLQTQAARLQEANEALVPALASQRMLRVRVMSNAKRGRRQLARLKKYWVAAGVSEADIHRMIPDHPSKPSTKADAASPPLAVVDPEAVEAPFEDAVLDDEAAEAAK